MHLFRSALVSLAAWLALGSEVGRAQPPCPARGGGRVFVQVVVVQQFYTDWTRYPDPKIKGVWIRDYFVLNAKADGFDKHQVIWYANDPEHCYCYNPRTDIYWGRWVWAQPGNGPAWEFSMVTQPKAGARPKALKYQPPGRIPAAPGTQTTMQPPDKLPPV